MKLTIFISLLFTAFFAQAEVKPNGALVARLCGDNQMRVAVQQPTTPLKVCVLDVTVNESTSVYAAFQNNPVIAVFSDIGVDYYMVMNEEYLPSAATHIIKHWKAYKLTVDFVERSQGTTSTYLGPKTIDTTDMIEATFSENTSSPQFTIQSNGIYADLEYMAQTRSN